MKLVMLRHGESVANQENYWTGWLDEPLTEKGLAQAVAAGEVVAKSSILFDAAFTSVLQRGIVTCQTVMAGCDQAWLPLVKHWRLNERHYGALVGKNKDQMTAEYGAAQVKLWRRGYYEVPPMAKENHFDRRYQQLPPLDIPLGESLQMTEARVLPLWQDQMAPLLRDGKNLLVVGHGNSLRALVRYLEEIDPAEVDTIDIPNAQPVLYEFDENLQIIHKEIL